MPRSVLSFVGGKQRSNQRQGFGQAENQELCWLPSTGSLQKVPNTAMPHRCFPFLRPSCDRPPPGHLTSEGPPVGAPLGAGSPTAEAGSWSFCAGRFCQGQYVVESSADVLQCPHHEVGKRCSLVGLESYTASHWAVWAAPHLLGSSGRQGKGCQAPRLFQVQVGGHWLLLKALS